MTYLPFYPPPSSTLSSLLSPHNTRAGSQASLDLSLTTTNSRSISDLWRQKPAMPRKLTFLSSRQSSANNSGTATPDFNQRPRDGTNDAAGIAATSFGNGRQHSLSTSSSGTSNSVTSSMPSSTGSKVAGTQSSDSEIVQSGRPADGKIPTSPISRTESSIQSSPRRKFPASQGSSRRPSSASAASSSMSSMSGSNSTFGGGRLGSRLPQGLFFDMLRPTEVSVAHKLETETYESMDDAGSLEAFRYRYKNASHLFYAAFVPLPLPRVSGPLSMSGPRPRKMVAFACATAASAYTARAFKNHEDDEDAWLVCLHSVVVAREYQRRGLALKLIEEYMRRLRKAEEGQDVKDLEKHGYECVAALVHEEMVPLFKKASFRRFRVSHVNSGAGSWIEMRRKIVASDIEEADEKCAEFSSSSLTGSTSSSSSQSAAKTPPSAPTSTFPRNNEASTTPTAQQEEKQLGSVAALSLQSTEAQKAWLPGSTNQAQSPESMSPIRSVEQRDAQKTAAPPPASQTSSKSQDEAAPPFSQAQVIAALQNQSKTSKSNTGLPYSTIMGQTLASKTSVEDAFYALEARLVDREDMSNLADLLCPREECGCVLLRGGTSDWEMAELGPLTGGATGLPHEQGLPSNNVLSPPLKGFKKIRNVFGTPTPATEATTSTPLRPFWIVHSPMIFDNIGFSRDVEWTLPAPRRPSGEGNAGTKEANEVTESPRKKLTRGPSRFFMGSAERKRNKEAREKNSRSEHNSISPISPLSAEPSGHGDNSGSGASRSSSKKEMHAQNASVAASPLKVKVKYLTCAECDCGPLGYTVLPNSLEGGKFAADIGKQTQDYAQEQKNASEGKRSSHEGSDSESNPASPPKLAANAAAQSDPIFYVAADRVRYHFRK